MNLNLNTTVDLSKEDVSNIITEHLKAMGYSVKGEVRFKFSEKSEGHGVFDRPTIVFKGALANVEKVDTE